MCPAQPHRFFLIGSPLKCSPAWQGSRTINCLVKTPCINFRRLFNRDSQTKCLPRLIGASPLSTAFGMLSCLIASLPRATPVTHSSSMMCSGFCATQDFLLRQYRPLNFDTHREIPVRGAETRSLPYKFEFGVDSGSIENNSLASYRFAVLDEKEALAWVAAFEESWSLTVCMDGAPSDSTRPEPLGLSSSSISNRRDELDGVRKAREIQKRMRKDGGLEIHQTEDKSSWSPVFTRARKLLLGIRAKASQIFRVVN